MSCNCLCEVNHKYAKGICTGESNRIIGFVKDGDATPVNMCDPCADETLAHKQMEDMQRNGT